MTAPVTTFRPDIEGLRAIAVSGVIAFHFGLSDLPGGFIGVDIFFVISGYLITRHLIQEIGRSGTVDLWRFYGRRARRLLPASLLVIATTLAAGYFILAPSEQQLYAKGALFASSYVINLWLLRWSFDYFAADTASNPFLHFWSLSVEEQFYLLWPAFLLLVAWFRPGARGIALILGVVVLVSFGVSALMTSESQPWAFYFSPLRAWEFAVGGLVSLVVAERWASGFRFSPVMGWTGIALIAVAYLSVSETDPFPGFIALLPVAGTAMLLLSGARKSAVGPASLLSLPPFQWTGKLSYSLYLWHWPVIVYATILWPDLTLAGRLACLAVTVGLSFLSYRYVENPVRSNGWLSAGSLRSLGLAALLTSLGVTLSFGAAQIAARSVGPEQKLIADSAARSSSARQIDSACVASLEQTKPRSCSLGASKPQKTIVLFGDSHADHWSTPLAKIAETNNWRLVTYLKSSCSVAVVPTWNVRLMRAYSECDAWRQTAMKEIASLKPDAVIVSQFSYSYVENDVNGGLKHLVSRDVWAGGLRASLAALRKTGAEVVLLRDVPVHKSYLDRCVARSLWQGRSSTVCDTPRREAIDERVSKTEQVASAGLDGVRYVDLTELFCNDTTCPAMIGGKLTFRDRHHIATPFAATLAGSMQRAIFGNQVAARWP
ncbi:MULTISPECIES: acyltransferase family protein [Aminobacter]|uniref:Peptidoglycan/LPS O-acetylase OafA/YrhL n=1 Tax=Aminobacter ciceronei TaxID=150723 RepID=A0ABR6CI12_9HYPH|nr:MULTISPECIES: acyltransferase family protein [Aminobacter]MBA8910877.1 peptidoglycan/LPS O-acetylase OafA/YrhL [Aminobacter ciceronei]MBA9024655.1 peptidoglycan/LPS O-acetylase OafA/YrhL [Aminobacter ciceronei]MRX36779.1 acyltransferase family protein [Aminobacter sp. MDW-2]QNH35457.1 acyltransferase [Aminobacter sp. MDW-2]